MLKVKIYVVSLLTVVTCSTVFAEEGINSAIMSEAMVEHVNQQALIKPKIGDVLNSMIVYPYHSGDIYQIYATPLNITDVQFEPGEEIISVAAGDTLRWGISKTRSGSETGGLVQHILIKPYKENLYTSMLVTTDRRSYYLFLQSTHSAFMTTVKWRHKNNKRQPYLHIHCKECPIDPNATCHPYKMMLKRGTQYPDWYPLAAFHDGKKTYIKFSSTVQSLPALFVNQQEQDAGSINYRVVNQYYVIDQVVKNAELISENGSVAVGIYQ